MKQLKKIKLSDLVKEEKLDVKSIQVADFRYLLKVSIQ